MNHSNKIDLMIYLFEYSIVNLFHFAYLFYCLIHLLYISFLYNMINPKKLWFDFKITHFFVIWRTDKDFSFILLSKLLRNIIFLCFFTLGQQNAVQEWEIGFSFCWYSNLCISDFFPIQVFVKDLTVFFILKTYK